ncbi:Calcium-dependent lipid-binding [Hirschfeldia incana]|nr:Calcium-dependent lipid-binding [Hirschfeldia incana]
MGNKTHIEICLISARGLRVGTGFGSSLLKHQWYAVGWIDPEDKYCTPIDASRSDNPLWRTKFSTLLDNDDDSKIQSLHVEVYSREPIFLRKKLHGSVTVPLKEFLAKYKKKQSSAVEETGSYQLRKVNSSKPQGFVDVSVRVSAERQDFGGFTGDFGGVMLSNNNSGYNSSGQNYMPGSSQHPLNQPNNPKPFSIPPDNHRSPMANPLTNNASPQMQQPYYPPPPMQPTPATSNGCYMPSYMPRSENAVNIPSSSSYGGAGRGYARPGPGGSAGLGAGAIVGAAAAFYGRDYLSGGYDLPTSLPLPNISIPNISLPNISMPNGSISIDPPF